MSGDVEEESEPTATAREPATAGATEEIIDPTADAAGAPPATDGESAGESAGESTDGSADGSTDELSEEVADDIDGGDDAESEQSADAETSADAESSADAGTADAESTGEPQSGDAATEPAGGDEADAVPDDGTAGSSTDDGPAASTSTGHDGVVPVGVKLGSTRTVIALPTADASGLRTVRTLTCAATYEDALHGEDHVLYGEEASTQYPDRVEFMLRSGLPEDDESAELASRFFSSVVANHDVPANSAVVYAIPTIDNRRGLENLERVIAESGVGNAFVESYPESLCASIPAFGDGLEAVDDIFVAVNMGSTNLEACAYRRGEQLAPFTTGAVTGNEVDRVIASNVEEETQGRVNVDTQTAREYKEDHADFDNFEPFTDVIQQPGGGAHEFTIERSVMEACDEYLDDVVEEFANTFLPELANEHMKVYQYTLDQPIVLTGGMVCIPGVVEEFERRLSDELQRKVEATAPDRPDLAATIGAQRIAGRLTGN